MQTIFPASSHAASPEPDSLQGPVAAPPPPAPAHTLIDIDLAAALPPPAQRC